MDEASGWTRVFGPFKGINLEGDMLVSEGGMKVNATEVDYRLDQRLRHSAPGQHLFP